MAINFNSFTTGTVGGANPIQSDDFVVGFDTAVPSGERKWQITTLANAVSGVMNNELINKINQNSGDGTVTSVTGTAPISVANGTSTPAISIAAATTSAVGVAELATLAEVQTGVGTNTIVTPETLNTLLQTLSTNIMNNTGNYPYLEYAWVTAPNAAVQTINANTITTLTLNTEVADTGGHGSLATNEITLLAGTYRYKISTSVTAPPGLMFIFGIATSSDFITKRRYSTDASASGFQDVRALNAEDEGQINLPTNQTIRLQVAANSTVLVAGTFYGGGTQYSSSSFTLSTANTDQRTTIRLWKVG